MGDIRVPDKIYDKVIGWKPKFPSVRTNVLLISIAIHDYDEKIKKMTKEELRKLNDKNKKLCDQWIADKTIPSNARGIREIEN